MIKKMSDPYLITISLVDSPNF